MRMPTPGREKRAGTHPQPQNWRATEPGTGGHQTKNWTGHRYFFNLVGDCKLWQVGSFMVSEVAGWSSSGMPT